MLENVAAFKQANIRYIPWVETPLSGPMGLLKKFQKKPKLSSQMNIQRTIQKQSGCFQIDHVKMYTGDSDGVIPMSWTESAHSTAHGFRRFVHSNFSRTPQTWPKFNPIPKDTNHGRLTL